MIANLISMDDGKVYDEFLIPIEDGTVPEKVLTGPLEQA